VTQNGPNCLRSSPDACRFDPKKNMTELIFRSVLHQSRPTYNFGAVPVNHQVCVKRLFIAA